MEDENDSLRDRNIDAGLFKVEYIEDCADNPPLERPRASSLLLE